MLKVCIDTNVWISGLLYSGVPAEVVDLALKKKFELILSKFILDELEKKLIHKFELNPKLASQLIFRIAEVAALYEPKGLFHVVSNMHADNLILETAWIGKAQYLVTGDRKHLLPLEFFKNVEIISPSDFLKILK
ncbi:MAG: putative toxin-antitoxin system toxin component, PIN family [Deltaproteobacteria bacterium RIFCSPHIGHO2_02_FULL_40_11]|nr:MAG: putative toxin-antitoxin system toxin component, PIN family [Deltaproteobacteria bacterium RIFCSPHIGHO2_02_FULL_40_11]